MNQNVKQTENDIFILLKKQKLFRPKEMKVKLITLTSENGSTGSRPNFESESKSTNFKFPELDSPVDTGNENDTNSGGSDVYPKNRNMNLSFPCL